MSPAVRTALVVVAVFAAGAVSGFAAHGLVHERGPRGGPHGMPPHLRELNLTPEQETKARDIFERHHADLEAMMKQSLPRARARTEQMEQELRAILTEPQARQLDELRKRRPPPPFGEHPGPLPPPPPGDEPPMPR